MARTESKITKLDNLNFFNNSNYFNIIIDNNQLKYTICDNNYTKGDAINLINDVFQFHETQESLNIERKSVIVPNEHYQDKKSIDKLEEKEVNKIFTNNNNNSLDMPSLMDDFPYENLNKTPIESTTDAAVAVTLNEKNRLPIPVKLIESPKQSKSSDEKSSSKKRRSVYSKNQTEELEKMYNGNNYHMIDNEKLNNLSKKLNLTPRQIKIWFQNRRTKDKKFNNNNNKNIKTVNTGIKKNGVENNLVQPVPILPKLDNKRYSPYPNILSKNRFKKHKLSPINENTSLPLFDDNQKLSLYETLEKQQIERGVIKINKLDFDYEQFSNQNKNNKLIELSPVEHNYQDCYDKSNDFEYLNQDFNNNELNIPRKDLFFDGKLPEAMNIRDYIQQFVVEDGDVENNLNNDNLIQKNNQVNERFTNELDLKFF